jgi:hypothetical protein
MLDPRLFAPLPAEHRRRLGEEFLAFVAARDGQPDLAQRTLARREAWFEETTRQPAPPWRGEPVDPTAFGAWHRGERPLREAPPLVIWLVLVARANEGEAWGVDYLLERGGFQGLGRGGRLRPRDYADLEETYHTRILRSVVQLFGVDFTLRLPPRPVQQSVKFMAYAPERLSFTLLGAGELMGTVAFLDLARRGDRLLADHPDVAARVRALFDEILIDEIGHVTYLLGTMTRWQLALVRRIATGYQAFLHRGYGRDYRETVVPIIAGIRNYSLGLFPERVLRRAFVPEPYWPAEYVR